MDESRDKGQFEDGGTDFRCVCRRGRMEEDVQPHVTLDQTRLHLTVVWFRGEAQDAEKPIYPHATLHFCFVFCLSFCPNLLIISVVL